MSTWSRGASGPGRRWAAARLPVAVRGGRRWGLLVGLVWAGMVGASATRWVPLTIEQLAARAELVVHARVEALEVSRDAAGRVFTRVELAIREVWKGHAPGDRCGLVAGGGILGTRAETSDAHARYELGEELVAYLVRNPAGEWVTVGMAQGRFLVQTGPSRERWAVSPFWGHDGLPASAAGGVRWPSRRPLALEELERRTREAGP